MLAAPSLCHTPRNRLFDLVTGLRVSAALGLCVALITATTSFTSAPHAGASKPDWDPSQFLLNAFLLPALEQGALPLRWFDPRPNLHCGPNTMVLVNGAPLTVGTAVPNQPFELMWQAHDCRPFGFDGPRFNGSVTLTVFREDWGFSTMVEPAGLHFTWGDGQTVQVQPGVVSMPRHSGINDLYD